MSRSLKVFCDWLHALLGCVEYGPPRSCGGCALPALPYVVVKALPGKEAELDRVLREEFPQLDSELLFKDVSSQRLAELVAMARRINPDYVDPRFLAWRRVGTKPGLGIEASVKLLTDVVARLRQKSDIVEEAELERPGPGPAVQKHFEAAPRQVFGPIWAVGGIDAVYAWTNRTGSDGTGVNFVDLERGWSLPHALLPGLAVIGGQNDASSREHGTNVLGVLCMQDDAVHGHGGATAAIGHAVSCVQGYTPSGEAVVNHQTAITQAIDKLTQLRSPPLGDVLLIESTIYDPASPAKWAPIELISANFDAIKLATTLGITVVEAGGNGTNWSAPALNLDDWPPGTAAGPFSPGNDDWRKNGPTNGNFKDSGAIIVSCAAVTPLARPTIQPYSPVGLRIDCWGWASKVGTLSTGPGGWNADFGGTSAAAAMVAAAAIIKQGVERAKPAPPLSAQQMRLALSDRTPGVNTPASDSRLGVMPNLRKLV